MSEQLTLDQLEHQIEQLAMPDQLRLVAHISARLSSVLNIPMPETLDDARPDQRARDAEALLAVCNSAAEDWTIAGDSGAEIRQIRADRDEQLWPSR